MNHRNSQRHSKLRKILRDRRIELGLSQQELCIRLKRNTKFVSQVEVGTRMLEVCEFVDYAKALKVEPGELLNRLA